MDVSRVSIKNTYNRLSVICWKNEVHIPCNELQGQNYPRIVTFSSTGLMYIMYSLKWHWFIEVYRLLPWQSITFSYFKIRSVSVNKIGIFFLRVKTKRYKTLFPKTIFMAKREKIFLTKIIVDRNFSTLIHQHLNK